MTNVLVNQKKVQRAKLILNWIEGGAKVEEETKLATKFRELIKNDKVKDEDRVEYIYGKLGGLIRTEVEHKKAEQEAKEAEEKYNKGSKR